MSDRVKVVMGTGDIVWFSPARAEAYSRAVRRGAGLDRLSWASTALVLVAAAVLAFAQATGWRP